MKKFHRYLSVNFSQKKQVFEFCMILWLNYTREDTRLAELKQSSSPFFLQLIQKKKIETIKKKA